MADVARRVGVSGDDDARVAEVVAWLRDLELGFGVWGVGFRV